MIYRVSVMAAFFVWALFGTGNVTHAQIAVPGIGNTIQFAITPENPVPGSTAQVKAVSSVIDLESSALEWSVNGTIISTEEGQTSITVPVSALGGETVVQLMANDGTFSASAQARIVPTQVDLLWEADAYTPPFYAGKSYPSPGSTLRMQALARFVRADGTIVPPNAIRYTWKKDGRVLGNVSGKGKASVLVPAPSLYGNSVYQVEAMSTDGAFSGTASTSIAAHEPMLMLYQEHPLFGLMYWKALGSFSPIKETEMGFVAIPYFAPTATPRDSALSYTWKVNNTPIIVDRTQPDQITINSENSDGNAKIQLELTHDSNMFLDSFGTWSVQLASDGLTPGRAALPPTTKDAFHQAPSE